VRYRWLDGRQRKVSWLRWVWVPIVLAALCYIVLLYTG